MRVLIVANYNTGRFSPFVEEQLYFLKELGITIDFFGIIGKGPLGYLKNLNKLKRKIKEFKPDLIHAHYGLSGLLANLQRRIPVVTTYHGSDIHSMGWILKLSQLCMKLSKFNIFVSQEILDMAGYKKPNHVVQSCGVDTDIFKEINRDEARHILNLEKDKIYILFGARFDNAIKNSKLAIESVRNIDNCELLELKNYTKQEVALLMNAVDVLLVTSLRESGPLVVKEAMACNRALVSTKVGDVRTVIGNIEGCFLCDFDVEDCTAKLKQAIGFSKSKRTKGRERIIEIGLSNKIVASNVKKIYDQCLS